MGVSEMDLNAQEKQQMAPTPYQTQFNKMIAAEKEAAKSHSKESHAQLQAEREKFEKVNSKLNAVKIKADPQIAGEDALVQFSDAKDAFTGGKSVDLSDQIESLPKEEKDLVRRDVEKTILDDPSLAFHTSMLARVTKLFDDAE